MKKSIFIAVIGVSSGLVAFGQGKVQFSNYYNTSSPQVTWSDNAAYVPSGLAGMAVGSQVNAELAYYVGTSSGDVPTSLAQMTMMSSTIVPFGLAGGDADGSSYAGWFSGGVVTIPGVTSANNNFVSFAILAFTGSDYTSALYSGASSIFQSPVTGGSSDPVPAFLQGAWQNFTVAAVPEPTTLALAGLGGFGMLMALRRKKD